MSDITLANLNMLLVRYATSVDRERHVPLGPLYLVRALEDAGFDVDFRDYQTFDADDPFQAEAFCRFLDGSADVVGVSCMANLLPFALLALERFKERHPEKTVLLGGVGPKSVERTILERFPWIDVVARGESERTLPHLLRTIQAGGDLARVPGIAFRNGSGIVETAPRERIDDLDAMPFPAYHHIDLPAYDATGMITSRGCPYPCTFCSVAPVWDHTFRVRSNESVIDEMRFLHEEGGAELFLFQDEFFVASPKRARSFCRALERSGLKVRWKAFGRVNLTDEDTMRAMADAGCVEIRYGIESGSDRVLEATRKGFTSADAVNVVSTAVKVFPRVDVFYVWGFPFETMDDFYRSVFQMVSFRSMGARILPSLLSLLPQTVIYEEWKEKAELEFCREIFPEYMLTGHEVIRSGRVEIEPHHAALFDFIEAHPDLFPGFFHIDVEGNVKPKLAVLQEMGFYPKEDPEAGTESCGAHSPRMLRPQDLATR